MTRSRSKNADREATMRSAAAPARAPTNDRTSHSRAEWLWPLGFLTLTFLVGCVQIEDPDIWWHLRTGQLIFERGEVPRTDWFTYSNPDSPWIDLHWGFQLIAAALWSLGGAAALVVFKSLLGTATFAIALLASRRGWPAWQSVACWLPSVLIYSGRNLVRPEMFTFLFLTAELAIVFHARRRPRLAWLLPVIQILWINMHGLFVLGLVVWFCFLAGEIVRATQAWRRPPEKRRTSHGGRLEKIGIDLVHPPLGQWLAVTGLMLAASLVNPYGLAGVLFPFTLLRRIQGVDHAFYSQFSGEFRGFREFVSVYGVAPVFGNLTMVSTVALFVLGVLSFTPQLLRRRLPLDRALLFAAFAYLAWQANRNGVLFALVGGVVLRANVGEWLETISRPPRRKFHLGPVLAAAVLAFLIIGVPFDLLTTKRPAEIPRLFGFGEIPGAFAHDAARFLGREGMPRRCFAIDEGAAAVYIFHNGPERSVFADARLEVNTRRTLERYLEIERQLALSDPRFLESLTEGILPEPAGSVETPAILISLRYLVSNPMLAGGVARLRGFRTVYVDNVAMVLLDEKQADRLHLPPASD
ncbi:MAG TPA: hypothetical protein VJ783_05600 [Pirellulales bacterium]|nr:hypothetical protein [Pirellulales bacterium]